MNKECLNLIILYKINIIHISIPIDLHNLIKSIINPSQIFAFACHIFTSILKSWSLLSLL